MAGTTIKNKLSTCFFIILCKILWGHKTAARLLQDKQDVCTQIFCQWMPLDYHHMQWPCPLLYSWAKIAAKRMTINEVHMTDARPHPDSLAYLHCHLATALHMKVRELSQHCTAALSFNKIHMRCAILFAICNMARHPAENHKAKWSYNWCETH